MKEPETIAALLRSAHTIAVVGLSPNWYRPSFFAAKYMQAHGYRIRPVNPRYAGRAVLGMPCVARLEEIDEPVDLVDVFRRTEDVLQIAQSAVDELLAQDLLHLAHEFPGGILRHCDRIIG